MKIVVIGGSGLIGKKVVTNLAQRGHDVVAASPSTGVNTLTGEGLAQALAGARVWARSCVSAKKYRRCGGFLRVMFKSCRRQLGKSNPSRNLRQALD